jgi:hypothetical protein
MSSTSTSISLLLSSGLCVNQLIVQALTLTYYLVSSIVYVISTVICYIFYSAFYLAHYLSTAVFQLVSCFINYIADILYCTLHFAVSWVACQLLCVGYLVSSSIYYLFHLLLALSYTICYDAPYYVYISLLETPAVINHFISICYHHLLNDSSAPSIFLGGMFIGLLPIILHHFAPWIVSSMMNACWQAKAKCIICWDLFSPCKGTFCCNNHFVCFDVCLKSSIGHADMASTVGILADSSGNLLCSECKEPYDIYKFKSNPTVLNLAWKMKIKFHERFAANEATKRESERMDRELQRIEKILAEDHQ